MKPELTFTSLSNVHLYGDLLACSTAGQATLYPGDPYGQGIELVGKLPKSATQVDTRSINNSLRSGSAQSGMERASLSIVEDTVFSWITNVGAYALSFAGGVDINLGAIYHVTEGAPSSGDIRRYIHHLQAANPQLHPESLEQLELEQSVVWIETPTLLGPTNPPDPHTPIEIHHLPRGSNRRAMDQVLNRKIIARAKEPQQLPQKEDTIPFSTLQTAVPINPLNNLAFMIDGFAVLDTHEKIITRGFHGSSPLVAQPRTTHENGRAEHEIIAEIHEYPSKVLEYWQKGYRVGFYGHPVRLTLD